MRFRPALTLLLLAVAPTIGRSQDGPKPFAWKDGDRVVLLGDTLVERDQDFGYLETLITTKHPDKNITFRNLGWSGDDVRGLSRAGFGDAAEGTKRQREALLTFKPTVVILGYGMADSFDGEAGLPRFVAGLKELVDLAESNGARVVLMSPIAHEDLGRPLPDPAKHNQELMKYTKAIEQLARERQIPFINLYLATGAHDRTRDPGRGMPMLTDDGLHLTSPGSYLTALVAATGLGCSPHGRTGGPISIQDGKVVEARGTTVTKLESSPDRLRFELLDDSLPIPRVQPEIPSMVFARSVNVSGLQPGRYTLKVDGKPVAAADDRSWKQSVVVKAGPEFDQVEALRRAINEKNRLYFYRWRPQNETYLFGFRKHEQGNNAREIPLFDPLVEAKEAEIARLRVPVVHQYELVREPEGAR